MLIEKNFSLKAILLGWVVDMGSSLVFGLIIGIVMGLILGMSSASTGVDAAAIQTKMEQITRTTQFLIFQLGFGLMFTAIGGFVTAYIAKESELRHAFAMGSLSLASGLLLMSFNHEAIPGWYWIVAIITTIPSAMMGGALCLFTKDEVKK